MTDSMKSETQAVRTRWIGPRLPEGTDPTPLVYIPVLVGESDDEALQRHLRHNPTNGRAMLACFFDGPKATPWYEPYKRAD